MQHRFYFSTNTIIVTHSFHSCKMLIPIIEQVHEPSKIRRSTMSILDECCKTSESLAMASVPMQEWCEPYDWNTALSKGTIFPCLNMEFFRAQDIPCSICSESQSPQAKKLNEINTISFAVNDLTLYLDTHPTCEKGLSLLKELLKKRLDLLAEYAEEYVPLTHLSMITGTPDTCEYGWPEGPLPWEGGHI